MASEVPIQPQLPRETRRDVSLAPPRCGFVASLELHLILRHLPWTHAPCQVPSPSVVIGTSSWVSPTLQDASSWTCLPVVPCLHHGRVQAAAPTPRRTKGPWGRATPKGHAKTRECRCVWGLCRPWPWGVGALVQDSDEWPRGRSQSSRSTFQSLSSLPSCLFSGKGTSFTCQSHTQGKGTGGWGVQGQWSPPGSGSPAALLPVSFLSREASQGAGTGLEGARVGGARGGC